MSTSVAATNRLSWARELQDGELDVVSGGIGDTVTYTFTVTNSPSFRGGVHSNETITIHGNRTE